METVCDDGVCSKCIKTGEGIKPWLVRNRNMDVEDYLSLGYVCSLDYRDLVEAHTVCDDGLCVGCRKPQWSWTGGRGDVERYLEQGYRCFLVRDVPEYGLADSVEVVCDDGECFGCMKIKTRESGRRQERSLSVEEMVSQGYTCTRVRSDGPGVSCEEGKCYHCSPPARREMPVSSRFLDTAEDHLEDGYNCGLAVRSDSAESPASEVILCQEELCLICWRGGSRNTERRHVRTITEASVEKAERMAKRGEKCVVVFSKSEPTAPSGSTACDAELCFICRSNF